MSIGIYFIFIILLFFMNTPIAFCLIIPSLFYFLLTDGVSLSIACTRIFNSANSFTLLAIPFFILAGQIMNTGGITKRIFRFASKLVGHYPGGLGHANVVASIIFSGMSGSAIADAAGLGLVEIKAMTDEGYDLDFSAAVTAASSTIGPIFPPSIPLVIYGVIADVSVGRLLIGGAMPGLLIGVSLMLMIYYMSKKANYPRFKRSSFKEVLNSLKESFPALFTIIIILGGILSGIVTPTEAAVLAVGYSFFLSLIVYKELTIKKFLKNIKDSSLIISRVMLIVAAGLLFGWIITTNQIPVKIANVFLSISDNPYLLLLLINILLLIMGSLVDTLAIMIILTPVLLPIVSEVGINLVHFGVMMTFNLMVGLLTPPYGLILYILTDITEITFKRLVRAIIPFYIPLFLTLLLITYFPIIVTFLPNLLMD